MKLRQQSRTPAYNFGEPTDTTLPTKASKNTKVTTKKLNLVGWALALIGIAGLVYTYTLPQKAQDFKIISETRAEILDDSLQLLSPTIIIGVIAYAISALGFIILSKATPDPSGSSLAMILIVYPLLVGLLIFGSTTTAYYVHSKNKDAMNWELKQLGLTSDELSSTFYSSWNKNGDDEKKVIKLKDGSILIYKADFDKKTNTYGVQKVSFVE